MDGPSTIAAASRTPASQLHAPGNSAPFIAAHCHLAVAAAARLGRRGRRERPTWKGHARPGRHSASRLEPTAAYLQIHVYRPGQGAHLRGKEIGCDTPRDRANSPLTERWPWGPARRGAPTILPAVQPAVLLSGFGAGGPRAFVTLSRKLHICMSRKPGLAGACRYYLRLGAWARRRLSSDTTRTSSRFSPDLSAAASIPTGSRCGGRHEVRFAGK